jgi:capsular polysaccharide biosynthesis protein/GGDEF domain-containing protein
MEVIAYVRILIKNWYLFLLGLMVTVIATLLFTLNQPKLYQAKASFVIRPRASLIVDDEFVSTLDTLSRRIEINNTFAEVADSRLIKQLAAGRLDLENSQLSGLSVNSRVLAGTNVLEITVKGKDPDLIRDFTGAVSAELITYVSELYDVFELGQLDEAETPRQPVSPKTKLNLMLGVALGSALGLALVFVAEYLRSPNNKQNHFDILDPASGLHNRAFFDMRLRQELSRSRHNNSPLSLALIRIKSHHIDDSSNAEMVEQLMPRIATLFSLDLRDEYILARFDKGTFGLMLPEVTGEEAQYTVKEMHIKLGSTPFQGDRSSSPLNVYGAAGVGALADWDYDEHAFLMRVVQALAEAERSPYGKVVLIDADRPTTSSKPIRLRPAERIVDPEEIAFAHKESALLTKQTPQQDKLLLDSDGGYPAAVLANEGKPSVEIGEASESLQKEVPATNGASPVNQDEAPELQPNVIAQKSEKWITPAALELANENGIVLHDIQGSGDQGRILISDVEELIRADQVDRDPTQWKLAQDNNNS